MRETEFAGDPGDRRLGSARLLQHRTRGIESEHLAKGRRAHAELFAKCQAERSAGHAQFPGQRELIERFSEPIAHDGFGPANKFRSRRARQAVAAAFGNEDRDRGRDALGLNFVARPARLDRGANELQCDVSQMDECAGVRVNGAPAPGLWPVAGFRRYRALENRLRQSEYQAFSVSRRQVIRLRLPVANHNLPCLEWSSLPSAPLRPRQHQADSQQAHGFSAANAQGLIAGRMMSDGVPTASESERALKSAARKLLETTRPIGKNASEIIHVRQSLSARDRGCGEHDSGLERRSARPCQIGIVALRLLPDRGQGN